MPGAVGRLRAEIWLDAKGVKAGVTEAQNSIAGLRNWLRSANNVSGKWTAPIGGGPNFWASYLNPAGVPGGGQPGGRFFAGLGGLRGTLMGLGAGAFIRNVMRESDEISDYSKRLQLTTREYEQLSHAAEMAGSNVSEAGKAMKRMTVSIAEARQGGQSAKLFAELGFGPEGVASLARGGRLENFRKMADAVLAAGDATARAKIEMQLFGKAGADVDALLKEIASGGLEKFAVASEAARQHVGQAWEDVTEGAWTRIKVWATEALKYPAMLIEWLGGTHAQRPLVGSAGGRGTKGMPILAASPLRYSQEEMEATGASNRTDALLQQIANSLNSIDGKVTP